MKLYLIRHGQTEWNVERRMQGWQDSPLTSVGVEAAEALGRYLKDTKIDHVYCSTSGRASKTAELICKGRDIKPVELDELRELCMGKWEGVKIDEITKLDTLRHDQFLNDPMRFDGGSGESFLDIMSRTKEFLADLVSKHGESNDQILVVTHTVTIKAFILNILGKTAAHIWETPHIHPVSMTLVDYGIHSSTQDEALQSGKHFKIEAVGITPHL